MRQLLTASLVYMIAGVGSGLFYREFTKLQDFPEGQFTQLGLAHTHLLILGFIFFLIVLALDKLFSISAYTRLFNWFFWVYNAGVVLTSAMLIWHGSLTVIGSESNKMISGFAGLGHMLLAIGMVLFFVLMYRTVPRTGNSKTASAAAKA